MRRVVNLYRSSIGKKAIMAVTGAMLFGFVIGHLAGNLKVYQGPEKYNAYAEFLREMGAPIFGHGELLWIARLGLLAAVGLHVLAAVQLTTMARRARPTSYQRPVHLEDTYASRTMRWGGVIIAAFVIYHLMHLTWGTVHPDFVPGDVYHNLVGGFSVLPVSAAYILAMLPLGLHLYHGLWSALQTLGVNNPADNRWRRVVAGVFAAGIVAGNVSIPLSVVLGIVG